MYTSTFLPGELPQGTVPDPLRNSPPSSPSRVSAMNAPPSESDTQPTPPKLLDQVRHKLRLKHHAASTEKQYVSWIRRFILFHEKRHPRELGRKDVERFLTHLAVDRHVASSTQNQAFAALLFLYRDV